MKRLVIVFTALSIVLTTSVNAQSKKINADASSIEWTGKKIGGTHDGNIQLKSGSLEMKNGNITGGEFVVDMTSITNNDLKDPDYNGKLVGHLKSADFFNVEEYPTATLKIKSAEAFSSKGTAKVTGVFTIKGISKEITFDASKADGGYAATINIDRSEFDVRYGSKTFFSNIGDKAIDDIFTLDVKLAM